MKKILVSLATVTLLVGCSSADKQSDLSMLQGKLTNAKEEKVQIESMIGEYRNSINSSLASVTNLEKDIRAVDAFVNPEDIFNKNGVVIRREKDKLTLVMPTDVVFDFNKAAIKEDFKPLLDTVSEALNIYKSVTVQIDGHTDNIGSYDYNLELSKKRADSAMDYLVSKGIDGNRIETKGYSFSKPIAPNATQEGRDKNRRIEVVILNKK